MYKVEFKDYADYIQYIDKSGCGAVYPCSVAEKIQQGDIFTASSGNYRSVLYWHYSGFAFIFGEYDERFLESVYDLIQDNGNTNSRRFILFVTDGNVERFFRKKGNTAIEPRYFFEYGKDCPAVDSAPPVGYGLCEINDELFQKINGAVTPAFFWSSSSDFLEKGKGYCIVKDGEIAAWAFSAAVSSGEIDIGIETGSGYRHLGFAGILAEKMIHYCFNQHKAPVWACHYQNIASRKLAEKLGFVKTSECLTVKKLNK